MVDQSLAQQAHELNNAAQKALEDLTAGAITEAEFNTTMEHCEKDSSRRAVLFKAKQRANQFQAGQIVEDGTPPELLQQQQDPDFVPDGVKEYRNAFSDVCKAANANTRHRGGGSFNFGFKSAWEKGENVYMKVGGAPFAGPYQGIAGVPVATESSTGVGGITVASQLAGSGNVGQLGAWSPGTGGTYFLGGTAGPAIEPEFIPGIVEMRFFPTVIESLFPALPVSSPIITYVSETGWVNAAAATPEAGTKPTSSHTLQRFTEQVGKIANLERTTDEMIQDAAYVWALFQRRLVMGVQRRTEVELLAGTGYPGVNGLLSRTGAFTIAAPATLSGLSNVAIPPTITGPFGSGMGSAETVSTVTPGRAITPAVNTAPPTGNDIALAILQMMTDLRTITFFEPDAIVINPQDYYTLRTSTDKNGQYFGGSFWGRDYGYPQDAGSNQLTSGGVDTFSLWGKKLVTTPVMPPGLILVGDFADAGAVLRLGGMRVDVTNMNGTDFEQNMWTARAEARVGLLVERPYLFELGVITSPAGTAWGS
jgi:HK97 family phage major capsid protein